MDRQPNEYEFPDGIPAFEQENLLRLEEPPSIHPFVLLESVVTPGLRFVCIPVEWLEPAYELELSAGEKSALGDGEPIRLFAIVNFPESGSPTANLRAPVVLNVPTRRGLQSIQCESQHSLFAPLRRENSCGEAQC